VTAWAFGAAGLSATQGLTIAVVYGLFAFVAALPGLLVIISRAVAAARLRRARARVAVLAPISVVPALVPLAGPVTGPGQKALLPVRELVASGA
jgi:hypothetical protein